MQLTTTIDFISPSLAAEAINRDNTYIAHKYTWYPISQNQPLPEKNAISRRRAESKGITTKTMDATAKANSKSPNSPLPRSSNSGFVREDTPAGLSAYERQRHRRIQGNKKKWRLLDYCRPPSQLNHVVETTYARRINQPRHLVEVSG